MLRTLPVLLLLTLPASAQTANEILAEMAAGHAARVSVVEDYTVVSDAFTSYHKKYVDAAGEPYFKTATEGPMGVGMVGNMTTTFHTDDLTSFASRAENRAVYRGQATLRGLSAHVLTLTDFSGFATGTNPPPDSVRFHVHPDHHVLMRIEMFGTDAGGGAVTPTIDFEDYQEVDGWLQPFITRVTIVGAAVTVTQAQVNEAQAAIAQIETRLAAMPAAQRDMIMASLQPQIDRMQQIVDSGTLETVFQVTEVRVNTGLSDSLFQ